MTHLETGVGPQSQHIVETPFREPLEERLLRVFVGDGFPSEVSLDQREVSSSFGRDPSRFLSELFRESLDSRDC